MMIWIHFLCRSGCILLLLWGSTAVERFDGHFGDFTLGTTALSSRSKAKKLISFPYTSTGTTIVGICCRDGVVLGSDTRSTGGSVVMDKDVLKMHYIAPSIRCCAAGTSADCEYLCNEAQRVVALDDIENHAAGDFQELGSVRVAVESIMKSLSKVVNGRGKPPSAVFLLGGVDRRGAQLYQIEETGTPVRLPFASLGSGSLDALAVLENSCHQYKMDKSGTSLDMSIEEATMVVRKAVQAGILNDLGSGSHVDLCCIEGNHGKVRQWREELRLPESQRPRGMEDGLMKNGG